MSWQQGNIRRALNILRMEFSAITAMLADQLGCAQHHSDKPYKVIRVVSFKTEKVRSDPAERFERSAEPTFATRLGISWNSEPSPQYREKCNQY